MKLGFFVEKIFEPQGRKLWVSFQTILVINKVQSKSH